MLGPVFKLGSTSSGGGGTVTSPGLHPYRIPMADNTQELVDSKLQLVNATSNDMYFGGHSFAISAAPADASASFQIDDSTKGVLINRMTQAQRLAIAAPADGLLVYQTNGARGIYRYDTILAAWQIVGAGTVSSPGMNAFKFPVADAAQNIIDSRLQQDGAPGNNIYFSGQSMNIGAGVADNSAILEADSTVRGFLEPRMTNAQRAAILAPATGLQVFCTDAPIGLYYYNGVVWILVGTGSGTVTSTAVFFNKVPVLTSLTNIVNSALGVSGSNWAFDPGVNLAVQQLKGNGTAPVATPGAGAGGAGSSVTLSGSDMGGNVVVVFGAVAAGSSVIFSVAFNVPYSSPPRTVMLTMAGNALNPTSVPSVDAASITVNGFDFKTGTVGLAATTRTFFYIIIQ